MGSRTRLSRTPSDPTNLIQEYFHEYQKQPEVRPSQLQLYGVIRQQVLQSLLRIGQGHDLNFL
jgi:hypothetical protein